MRLFISFFVRLAILISFVVPFLVLSAFAQNSISIRDRIETQKFLKATYPLLFEKSELGTVEGLSEKLKGFSKSDQNRARELVALLDPVLPEKVVLPLVYWRVIEPKPKNVSAVLQYHALNRLLVLRDYLDEPRGSQEKKESVLAYLRDLAGDSSIDSLHLYEKVARPLAEIADRTAAISDDRAMSEQVRLVRLFAEDFKAVFPFVSDAPGSWLGFVPGNRVELISDNERSLERVQWLNERAIFAGGKLDMSAPYMNVETHPTWAKDPIFKRIKEMVGRAKDSLFIDIFLFGGTMGGALAKYVVDQTIEKRKANPNFRTLFLHDFATNYNMKDEMMPIFEYMRDRIKNEPLVAESFILLQANIQRHPPGIPFGLTNLIPKTAEVFKVMEKKNTYYESKIDHSKVIVIDANTDSPEAYFGSKNWADHSGAYYYDNALFVAGPTAALVQAAYYDDVEAALTTDEKERSWMYFKELGFSNDHYLKSRREILQGFMILPRDYPAQGNQVVRLAEANVDGVIKDARNQLIEMIRKAEKHIYMEQLFIYDKYINDALMKRKLQVPTLDVRVLADHNGNFGMNGFPNTIFMREMAELGIQLRARRTLGITAQFPNGESRSYHQENHRKITSVDSHVMLVGSSNLNPDTLQGSFREFGAQVFDEQEIAKFENYFLKDWGSDEQTQDVEINSFKMKIGAKELSPALSDLINSLGSVLIRSKDVLEGKF